ncbi:UNVERIFIED_CONTAM: hypothetical protein GTU68_064848 [Idotea baltica]|nr:hypothetical protein [Idotea baltica]
MSTQIIIDGSKGEGGGQVLRTSLALSLATGKPFRIENIRAGRAKPGLLRQHFTCVKAAAALCDADVDGLALGSTEITFTPGALTGGTHSFAVGTAGSAILVLQSVLPALLTGTAATELTVEGGTHNPAAPPWEFFERSFLPILREMGASVDARIEARGFMPAGGGRIVVEIEPVARLTPVHLGPRGDHSISVEAIFAHLPTDIARRMLSATAEKLHVPNEVLFLREVKSSGPGGALAIAVEAKDVTNIFTAFASRGVASEGIAKEACKEVRDFLASTASVGRRLADQLLLPLVMAGSGSFTTTRASGHTKTNIETIGHFSDTPIVLRNDPSDAANYRVDIG